MKEQMSMFEDGGLLDEGGSIDPVSGNDVPPGSTQEEVRDDIPAQLSEGEFVFPADVVRFIGLGNLMQIRQQAKMGLKQMEAMGQMGNSDEATIPDDLPFDINDLDMEDDGVVEFADGGLAGPNSNTGVYFNPALPQQDIGYIKAAPVQAASSTYQAPQQYVTPTMAQTTTPSFEQFVQPEEGMKPELRTYINSATGEKIQITFINGQPTTPIPDGYVPASEYVKPESVKTEKVTAGSTNIGSVSDSGNEDARQAEEAMYGPGGGRLGVAGNVYGVSFNNMGGLPGVTGTVMTSLGLVTGKPIPAEAVVTLQRPDRGLPNGVDKFSVTGTAYNNFKAIAEEYGYNSRQAEKAMQEMRYDAKVIEAQKAANEVKEAEERVTITGSDESYDSSASGAGLESSVRGSSSPGGTGGTVTTETGTTGQGRQDYTGGTPSFGDDSPGEDTSGDGPDDASTSTADSTEEGMESGDYKGAFVGETYKKNKFAKQMKRSGLASK